MIHEIQETKMMHSGFLGHRAAVPKEAEEDERGRRGSGVARMPPGSPTEEPDGPGPIACGEEEVRAWSLALLADTRDELVISPFHEGFLRDRGFSVGQGLPVPRAPSRGDPYVSQHEPSRCRRLLQSS